MLPNAASYQSLECPNCGCHTFELAVSPHTDEVYLSCSVCPFALRLSAYPIPGEKRLAGLLAHIVRKIDQPSTPPPEINAPTVQPADVPGAVSRVLGTKSTGAKTEPAPRTKKRGKRK